MIPANEFRLYTPEQLIQKYGTQEVLSSVDVIKQIGESEYERKYGRLDPTDTASETGAMVPYDPGAGVFSLKNLSALAQNIPGNAKDTFTGMASAMSSPIETASALFSEEGVNAIIEDLKHQITNPGQTLVERPFETLLNLAPGAQAAGAVAKGTKLASTAARLAASSPKTNALLKGVASLKGTKTAAVAKAAKDLVVDPLGTSVVGAAKIGKGIARGAELMGFQIPSAIGTGLDWNVIGAALTSSRLSPLQKELAAPPLTKEGFKNRVLGKGWKVDPETGETVTTLKTPRKAFIEVLKDVKDEYSIMADIEHGISVIRKEIDHMMDTELPIQIGAAAGPIVIDDIINNFKANMRKHKVPLAEYKHNITPDVAPTSTAGLIVDARGRPTYTHTPGVEGVSVKQLKLDVARTPWSTLEGGDVALVEKAVHEINEYYKRPGIDASPHELWKLHMQVQNLIDISKQGASVVDGVLSSLSADIRDKLGTMVDETGKTTKFNDIMKKAEVRYKYLNAVHKEMGLYKNGESNAGTVLKKVLSGGRETNVYRQNILKQMEARVGPITTAMSALEMKGWTPKGLVGRQMGISAYAKLGAALWAGKAAAQGMIPAYSLLGFAFVSPRLTASMALKIGLPRRVADYIGDISAEVHKYPTALAMGKAGYTLGGILLHHGELARKANQRQAFGEE